MDEAAVAGRKRYLKPPIPILAAVERAAALLDGEGFISITFSRSRFRLVAGVVNTDPRLTEWMYQTFGGGVSCRQPAAPRRPAFIWTLQDFEAKEFLGLIGPHLIAKREHAVVVQSVPVSFDQLIFQQDHLLQMRRLNNGEHLRSLCARPEEWEHKGRGRPMRRKRLAILAKARKFCPGCHNVFGPKNHECLGRFWRRLFCSLDCARRVGQPWNQWRNHSKWKEG